MGRFCRMVLLLLVCVPLLSACAPLHHPEPYHHYYVGPRPHNNMAPPARPHFNGRPQAPVGRPLPPPNYRGHRYGPAGHYGRPAQGLAPRPLPHPLPQPRHDW